MSSKSIIKTALLAFVLVSIVFLAVKESRRWTTPDPVAAQGVTAAAQAPAAQTDKTVAYYFHTTYRCPTCRRIEAFSREAIETGFAKELAEGKLEFRLVNVETPENYHFMQDYKLVTKSLVLSRVKDGKQVEWTNLNQVWQLTGDHDAFIGYVQNGVRGYLEKK